MFKKSLVLAAAIFAGTFCTAHAAGSAETQFVKTELSCLSGTSCAVRVPLPANKLVRLKGISCVNISENVTSVDVKIGKDAFWYFEARLYYYDERTFSGWNYQELFRYENFVIYTKTKELWLNLNSTVAGQMAATCYAAF